ncbi:maleylpyruvate isomerase family mycothiol-dependent enzyme [Mycolicibacterium litorale]|uniref:maleylpyruvate isomerase family mycothiol-dependent enzyme n=1 Tax=Mycolicibacterium litorale TaxID=758802 RepID=UPI003CEB019F
MDTDEIWAHIDAQRVDLADFLATLSREQWSTPSACAGWTVRDVAAHLTHSAAGRARLMLALVRSGFRFNAMVARMATEDPRQPDELVAALRGMAGIRRRPPGTAVADPLTDVLVHGQDIAIPLGVDRPMPVAAAVVAARRLWEMGFPFHARKRFAGVQLRATDADFTVGEGRPVTAPIRDIVLALSGRNSPVLPRV